jgi:hypothetical protein
MLYQDKQLPGPGDYSPIEAETDPLCRRCHGGFREDEIDVSTGVDLCYDCLFLGQAEAMVDNVQEEMVGVEYRIVLGCSSSEAVSLAQQGWMRLRDYTHLKADKGVTVMARLIR